MTRQTEAQRLAKALAHDYSTEDETAASNELIRLDARESQLIALLRQSKTVVCRGDSKRALPCTDSFDCGPTRR